MKEFNLEEYNELCAEFMELPETKTAGGSTLYYIETTLPRITIPVGSTGINATVQTGLLWARVTQLVFHLDWNWIMEIVGKIETLFDGFVLFNIEDENCFVAVTGVRNYHNYTTMATKKEAAVHAIWHFLNWYKENKS